MKKILVIPALSICALTFLFFSACYKTDLNSGTASDNSNHIPPDQTVIASLRGRVIDENGVPMQGASVVGGGVTTSTDVNGLFSLVNINLSSRFGYVKVSKAGYFTGSRSIITNGAASNYVNIQMVPRSETGSIPAQSGGVVVVQSGDSASFGANTVVTASTSAAYTGTVHVFMKYLDPTDANLFKYMPGDLRGIGSDGNETALQSFGMLLVELQGDAGQRLQIMNSQIATLTWAIPASLQSAAPATIPLWYFNDTTGRWIEQGTATRQGNSYVGKVSHFSFWNCDTRVATVNFKVRLKDQHGNPLSYTYFSFQSQTMGTRGGFTDSSGYADGLIPIGQTLVLKASTECGTMLGGANVGPALTDQDLGTIIITIDTYDVTFSGKVVDCSGNLIDSGMVNVLIDGLNYRANVVKGLFSLPVTRCYATAVPAVLTAYDFATSASGSETIQAQSGAVDAGQITACSIAPSHYVNYTLNGSTYHILAPPDNISYYINNFEQLTWINSSASTGAYDGLTMALPILTGTGSYTMDSLYVNNSTGGYAGWSLNCTISSYGPVNSDVKGSFSGSVYLNNMGSPIPITGNFDVIRTQ